MQTRQARTWVLALTSAAALMVALDALVVTTALSSIRADLGASLEQLEWTVNAYTLSLAVLLLTGAALGERFGRRRAFVAGIALFTAGSAACGLAPRAGWLIPARVAPGAGGALVMPLALALLSAAYPPERRGAALGIFSGVTGLAVLGGPVVGGAITQGIAWQWIFWLNVPLGLVLAPLARTRLAESFGPAARIDVPGLALVTGAALRPPPRVRRPGPRARPGRRAGPGGGPRAGQRRGRGRRRGGGRARRGRRAARRFRRRGAGGGRADAAAAAVRHARVRRRQRGGLLPVRLDLRQRLLHGPVPADRAGRRAVGGRPAAAAVDGDAVRHRAARGRAGAAGRRAPPRRRRASAAGGGHGLGRARGGARARLRRVRRPAGRRRGGRVDGDPGRAERGRGGGRASRHRPRVGDLQRTAPARRRVRRGGARSGVRSPRRLRLAAGVQRRLRARARRRRGRVARRRDRRARAPAAAPAGAGRRRRRRAAGRARGVGGGLSTWRARRPARGGAPHAVYAYGRGTSSHVWLSPCCWVKKTRHDAPPSSWPRPRRSSPPAHGRGSFAPRMPPAVGSPSETWMPVSSLSPSFVKPGVPRSAESTVADASRPSATNRTTPPRVFEWSTFASIAHPESSAVGWTPLPWPWNVSPRSSTTATVSSLSQEMLSKAACSASPW